MMPAGAVDAELVHDEAPAAAIEPARAELMRLAPGTSDALVLQRDPNDMLAEATKAAKALMAVMASKPDKVMMNGHQYIENEDWQTIGHFYGATAQIESDHFVEFGDVKGWEATAILVSRDGRTLGRATAMCLNDEEKWSSRAKYEWHYVMKDGAILNEEDARRRGNSAMVWEEGGGKSRPKKQKVEVGVVAVPMFQLRSMAQTRASSKVHRTVLAFVPVLAGFSPTPAEELPDAERVPNASAPQPAAAPAAAVPPPTPRPTPSPAGSDEGPDLSAPAAPLPAGFHLIDDFKADGDWSHVTWGRDAQGGSVTYKTKIAKVAAEARAAYLEQQPVRIHSKKYPWLDKVERLDGGMSAQELEDTRFKYDEEPPF